MKKKIIIPGIMMMTLVVLFSFAGCSAHQPDSQKPSTTIPDTKDISEYLIEEDGEQYLFLPISQSKIFVPDEYKQHLDNIDIELLITADESMCDKRSSYTEIPGISLEFDTSGYLCLYAEWIVDIEPPNIVTADNGEIISSGCNIDHEHIFFDVRITK